MKENQGFENSSQPLDMQIKSVENQIKNLESRETEVRSQIDRLMDEWKQNHQDTNQQKKELEKLEQKKYYTENYDLYLNEFLKEIDQMISRIKTGDMSVGKRLDSRLEEQKLFVEVCAEKDKSGEDFKILSGKITELNNLVEEKRKEIK
jgi:septal ring factor EnvC (AmiA/AmiB activator)